MSTAQATGPLPVDDTRVSFRKMHGLGNDFVVIDARVRPFIASRTALRRIADRRFGIGCDQLIVLEASPDADAFMRIFNPDGGEVAACGNATRCVGMMLADEKRRDTATIETRAGLLRAVRSGEAITVDMGAPRLDWSSIPLAGGGDDTSRVPIDVSGIDPRLPGWFSAVSMGNPHVIFFVAECGAFDLERIGPMLETHPLFPEKANISLAEQVASGAFAVRVWERAAGATLACGTAACAVAVAAERLGRAASPVRIDLPGGSLSIERGASGHVLMTGPATISFTGTIDPSLLASEAAA